MLKEGSLFSRKMPKQNATATIEGVRKIDQQRKGWRNEAEEYINILTYLLHGAESLLKS